MVSRDTSIDSFMFRFINICFYITTVVFTAFFSCTNNQNAGKQQPEEGEYFIKKTTDFEISGAGAAKNWETVSWLVIPKRSTAGDNYETKVKLLYSANGIYFLYSCNDRKLTNTMQMDFLDLWNEDVIEIFLQPDESNPAYFEYELSPLDFELPIIIFNEQGKLNSWIPFHYEDERKTRHSTSIAGGEKKPGGLAKNWMAEVFIPFALMKPVLKTLPATGTRWKGNLYRIDYDEGEALWSWKPNSGNFHEYDKFGSFRFE